MLSKKIDSVVYKETFIKKFTNFAEKAPIVISYATDDIGVTVVHENSGKKYFYPWDYALPIKTFIHDIKRDLIANHYPRLIRTVIVERPLTVEEQADSIANGTKLEDVSNTITETVTEHYRIDKVLILKDEVVLVNEETLQQFTYKMKTSAFSYLRNYRTGKFSDIEEASRVFFKDSTLLNELNRAVD